MKKYLILTTILLTVIFCNIKNANSQSTSANGFNTPNTPTDYLGWAVGVSRPLMINNKDVYPIKFYTNNNFRGTFDSLGHFGVGIAKPQSLLHINDGIGGSMLQLTNIATGNGSADVGFKLGLIGQTVHVNQQENSDMIFETGSINGVLNSTRMDITGVPGLTQGYIAIGPNFTTPKSLLHLNDTGFVYTQWTNTNTGANDIDGFKLGFKI